MIEVEKVTKDYGSFRAVHEVSFSIKRGEIVGLLGPNGAGKTTTMRMVTGFLSPTSGRITIGDRNIQDDPKTIKGKIGYLPESAPLYTDMIVEDYLRYVAEIQGVRDHEQLPRIAATCGLSDVMHKNISELSRGYRQRVGLAHALLHDPEILILDEPTSGLDPNQIIEVRDLIKKIGRTKTVVISTHILPEVEMLCDRVIIVSRGKIVADSPTEELRTRYGHRAMVRIQLAGCGFEDFKRRASALPGIEGVNAADGEEKLTAALLSVGSQTDPRPALFELAKENGWTLYEMSLQRNTLEDVFRDLTTGGEA